MKYVFIGASPRIAEMAVQSCRMGWPDVTPRAATTAADGLELVEQVAPDVVLLYPDFSDLSLCEAVMGLRRYSKVPLLVLGRQRDAMELVTTLELGADDYVRLPCALNLLTARIRALLRRAAIAMLHNSERPFFSGSLLVNPDTYEVFLEGQQVELTSTEFQLLHLLARNRGRVVSRSDLEQTIWGESVDGSGLLNKYVQRLRQKLGDSAQKPRWIASVHGIGYRFIGPAAEGAASAGTASSGV
jgi:DNA-binding response OmpR family regulator